MAKMIKIQPLVDALAEYRSHYDNGGADYSVTDLIQPGNPRARVADDLPRRGGKTVMPKRLERMERLIGSMLIIGVTISGAIVALGGALYLLHHGGEPVHYGVFTGEPTGLSTIVGVVTNALHLSGRAIIQLGLLVLVAIQLVRVVFTAWLFKVAHDRAFVYISLFVLAVLGYSLFGQG